MRYFLELAFNGSRYCGYQEQANQSTIQSAIEDALSTLLQTPTKIVGCGRTDSGVHALQFYIHFDTSQTLTNNFIFKLNCIIGKDIVFYNIILVDKEAHARYDARSRSYQYIIDLKRNPFRKETAFFCTYAKQLDLNKMKTAAKLLLKYKDFTTFCKSRTDTKTKLCDLRKSEWTYLQEKQQLVYNITADRFLRGMVRLIVGMCLNVGKGNLMIEEVETALESKRILKNAFSAPAKGLFLMDIKYNFPVK
ncbi:MAG: tRNA pseudouridine(38-40) synthase TruA [Saprospiraceae bacterium]|nr:tRNA pseudouridine(38-40) synthase TruA [Saprospiraceae bacterium]